MKNLVLPVLSVLLLSTASHAAVTCADLANEKTKIEVVREENILNEKNWKQFDVIANLDRRQCKDSISQEVIKVNGELFRRFSSNEDGCDGGNSLGAIYTYDLKTPVAHIFDSEIYCEKDWGGDSADSASNHKCDLGAEALAKAKMADFGFEFTELGSTLELRKDYMYSFIRVVGTLANKGGGEATVNVYTDINSCKYDIATIEDLKIYNPQGY